MDAKEADRRSAAVRRRQEGEAAELRAEALRELERKIERDLPAALGDAERGIEEAVEDGRPDVCHELPGGGVYWEGLADGIARALRSRGFGVTVDRSSTDMGDGCQAVSTLLRVKWRTG
jgi:hypothetical protein